MSSAQAVYILIFFVHEMSFSPVVSALGSESDDLGSSPSPSQFRLKISVAF